MTKLGIAPLIREFRLAWLYVERRTMNPLSPFFNEVVLKIANLESERGKV